MLAEVATDAAMNTGDSFHWLKDLFLPLALGAVGGWAAILGQLWLQKSGVWHSFSSQLWTVRVALYQDLVARCLHVWTTAFLLPDDDNQTHRNAYRAFTRCRARVMAVASEEVWNALESFSKVVDTVAGDGRAPSDTEMDQMVESFNQVVRALRDDLNILPLSQEAKLLFADARR